MDPVLMLSWLKERGLRPDHDFLDVGCGRLRSTIDVIGYLDEGRYFGFDQEPSQFVSNGTHLTVYEMVKKHGHEGKKPSFWKTDDFDCSPLGELKPVVVLAQSVFSHILPYKIERCLLQLRKHLSKTSVFYATYFPTLGRMEIGAPHKGRPKPLPGADEYTFVRYPDSDLDALARKCGYSFEALGGFKHPNDQVMGAYRIA